MDFERSFLRHTMLWTLPSGEVANCSVAWAEASAIVSLDDDSVDMLEAKGLALWNAIKGAYAGVAYVGSRVAWIGVTGVTVETADRSSAPVAATGGGNSLPHEVAVCASLLTATYSRKGRGRIFLPPPAYGALTTTARLDATIRGTMATNVGHYCEADVDTGLSSVIASKVDGQLREITTVSVGDVFDAQRRRRDALVEVRSTVSV